MTYPATPTRMVTVVAEQPNLTALWDGTCTDGRGLHVAHLNVGPQLLAGQGAPPPFQRDWAGTCVRCDVPIPWDTDSAVHLAGGVDRIWDTPSGQLEPGCMYWQEDREGHCTGRWSNCDGRHLHAVLPNGHAWNIDGRATNCTMPEDTTHRCWVREGEPPNVTAGKAGHTCTAGAGSILAGDYHGFLRDGAFTAG